LSSVKVTSLKEERKIKMNEIMAYVNMVKKVLDRYYGKEVVFYNEGEWYSRDHSRNISLDELEEYLLNVTDREEYHE